MRTSEPEAGCIAPVQSGARRPHGRSGVRGLAGALVALGVLAAAGRSGPSPLPRDIQTVDGMTIYLGVMPAGLVKGDSLDLRDPSAIAPTTTNPTRGSSRCRSTAL